MLSLKTTLKPSPFDFAHLDAILSRDMTGWLNLPDDADGVIPLIKKFVKERRGTWDKVLCLGMGGSALGITALKQAFFPFDDRLTVIGNLDSNTIHQLLKVLDPERTLILVISKSGTTLETMTAFVIFKEKFSKKQYQKNFIAITDPEVGELRKIAEQDGLTSFPIPPTVGGRFSVLSTVGLLPLALLGGTPEQLLAGAQAMKQRCFKKAQNNPAFTLAQLAYVQKKPIVTFFSYSDQLYSLGLWYQQLLAESIGKNRKVGLTPLPLRGASDQHSVLQLLQDGPNDKLNIFLNLLKPVHDVPVPNRKQSTHEILLLESRATEQALREDDRPTITIEVSELSEQILGELFMLFQMQIAILGELYQVDAFNQPGVEKSKRIVKVAMK
ncbi:MAG: glucose-6-phosphate isomerase [bacterium]|nr:glucose-6-phosphate isomerase [bacterium]